MYVSIKSVKYIEAHCDKTVSVSVRELVSLPCGVPQGSILEPIVFPIDMLPLGQIISSISNICYLYTDDTQLYFSL